MIHYITPYSCSKDLGVAYNISANLVKDPNDWICFLDGDTAFLEPSFGNQLQEIVDLYPDTGLFTCISNRIGNLDQAHEGKISEESNILVHRQTALQLAREKRHQVKQIKNPISGQLMLIKKATWEMIGGSPEGRGILAVDNTISNRIARQGLKILLMEGVFIFHFYRLDTGRHNKTHLL